MTKKKNTAKRASYKNLLEWRIASNLPDEWLVAVAGNVANEVYSLDQVRQMHVNSQTSRTDWNRVWKRSVRLPLQTHEKALSFGIDTIGHQSILKGESIRKIKALGPLVTRLLRRFVASLFFPPSGPHMSFLNGLPPKKQFPGNMKLLLLSLIHSYLAWAGPVVLTDSQGRAITAEVHGIEGEEVLISKGGVKHRIQIGTLDEASQKIARAAVPAALAEETRVRLRAQGVSAGRETQSHWKTSWGSYDRDVTRTRIVAASVECTLGGGEAELVIQWIASVAGRTSQQGVLEVERLPINLKPGEVVKDAFAQKFEESDANYEALGERERDGVKYVGWIVRVIAKDGKELAVQSSRPTLPAAYPLLKK
jgi:hypothetical protein